MIEETTTIASGSTDIIVIYLFGAIAVLLLALLVYVGIMFRKRYIRNTIKFNIIYKDGSKKFSRLKNAQKTNRVFNKTYFFDHKCIVSQLWGREIFYLDGVKEPINFNAIEKIDGISATELDAVIQEKITEKLLGGETIGTTEIMIIIAIVGIGIALFMLYNISSKGVTISPESISLIKDGFRSVINGG